MHCAYGQDIALGPSSWAVMVDHDTGDVVLHERPHTDAPASIAQDAPPDTPSNKGDYLSQLANRTSDSRGLSPAVVATSMVIAVPFVTFIGGIASSVVGFIPAVLIGLCIIGALAFALTR